MFLLENYERISHGRIGISHGFAFSLGSALVWSGSNRVEHGFHGDWIVGEWSLRFRLIAPRPYGLAAHLRIGHIANIWAMGFGYTSSSKTCMHQIYLLPSPQTNNTGSLPKPNYSCSKQGHSVFNVFDIPLLYNTQRHATAILPEDAFLEKRLSVETRSITTQILTQNSNAILHLSQPLFPIPLSDHSSPYHSSSALLNLQSPPPVLLIASLSALV